MDAINVQCVYGPQNLRHLENVLIPSLARSSSRHVRLKTINYDGLSSCRLALSGEHKLDLEDVENASGRCLGFAEAHNLLFKKGEPQEFFVILNPDCIAQKDAIDELVNRKQANASAAIIEGRQWPIAHPKEYDSLSAETPWASGAFQLIDSGFYSACGGMDESLFLYLEDVDLSWRAWLSGWKVLYEPCAVVTHFSGGPFYRSDLVSNEEYFGLRNFLVLSKKFFGDEGEKQALEMLASFHDKAMASLAVHEYREKFPNLVQQFEGQGHPMVKILGVNQFHQIK
jgi:hypothetical protein